MNPLLYPILIPLIAGALVLAMPKRTKGTPEAFSFVASVLTFFLTIYLFLNKPLEWTAFNSTLLRLDNLSSFIVIFVGLFGFLIIMYSAEFMKGREGLNQYYAYILWTIGASIGAVVSDNLILFLVFWGFLGLMLYLLIGAGGEGAKGAAKKSFIIVGGSDVLILFGICIIWQLTKTIQMSAISISLNSALAILAFISLAIGAFAKAGAMPVHTWIPASAEVAPAPIMAFLPASLDKLLGIYFLARISLDMFAIKPNSAMSILLLIVGSVTIIAAVMMALVQHNLKKLLSYHAVSQVGYMVLGIGTANPVGIAGGLFHMVNHAIYKACLFLSSGAVEHSVKETELDRLGGLSKYMPITFLSCLIASLAISGVPPFNGFASKWMVYQGVIELSKTGDRLWVLWLIAAVFGSALTLASFMKLNHATFLGQRPTTDDRRPTIKEVNIAMWLPMVTLAFLCILFGIFAYGIPLKFFVFPSLKTGVSFSGIWSSSLATLLILIGIAIGFIIYLIGHIGKRREVEPFIGGVTLSDHKEMRVSGVEFYETIRELRPLKVIYNKAEAGLFDIYELAKRATSLFTRIFQDLHNGVLPTYLVWCLLGMIILFLVLMG